MTTNRSAEHLTDLVNELRKLPRETEWVEFKANEDRPEKIGEYLSALANSAVLSGKAFAYVLWGISDTDHSVVGTSFNPNSARIGSFDCSRRESSFASSGCLLEDFL